MRDLDVLRNGSIIGTLTTGDEDPSATMRWATFRPAPAFTEIRAWVDELVEMTNTNIEAGWDDADNARYRVLVALIRGDRLQVQPRDGLESAMEIDDVIFDNRADGDDYLVRWM